VCINKRHSYRRDTASTLVGREVVAFNSLFFNALLIVYPVTRMCALFIISLNSRMLITNITVGISDTVVNPYRGSVWGAHA